MPGVGVRTAARILTEVVGKDFKSAAHLASYAGIAPVTRQSRTSFKGDTASRAYYDKKRAEGKRHNQAVIALARRRSDVLFAMLRDGTFYESRPAQLAPAA
jgi:transposase